MLRQRYRFWAEGGSALPAIELLIELGRTEDAASVSRLALSVPECADAADIERRLAEIESAPNGWSEAIDSFINAPSEESWRSILRFAPEERVYDWARKAFRDCRRKGCDPSALIRFGTLLGILLDAIELVDDGVVDPEVLIERAEVPGAARSFWLGLAAQATFLRGDLFGTIALLRQAQNSGEYALAIGSVFFISSRADEEMRVMMEKAGVAEV